MSFPGMELCLLFCKMLQTAIENSLKLCFKPDPTLMSFQGNWSHRAATKHLTAKNKKNTVTIIYFYSQTHPLTERFWAALWMLWWVLSSQVLIKYSTNLIMTGLEKGFLPDLKSLIALWLKIPLILRPGHHLAFEPINLNKAGAAFIKPGWKLSAFLHNHLEITNGSQKHYPDITIWEFLYGLAHGPGRVSRNASNIISTALWAML